MSFFISRRNSCYCAFCKTPRKLYAKKNVQFGHVLVCLILSLVVMFVIWQTFDPRFISLFIAFLFVAEIFVHLRWRIALVCRHCGFDPALYLKSSDKAVEKVKIHMEKRKNNPEFLLAPQLNLPFRKVDKVANQQTRLPSLDAGRKNLVIDNSKAAASKKGRLISKSV